MMIRNLLWGYIGAAALLFGVGYALAGLIYIGLAAVLIGVLWAALERRDMAGGGSPAFLLYLLLAVVGMLSAVWPGFMLLGLLAALAAWDLSRFRMRVGVVGDGEMMDALAQKHIQRLVITLGAGGMLALLPLVVSISLDFVVLAAVILALLLMLRSAVYALRSAGSADD